MTDTATRLELTWNTDTEYGYFPVDEYLKGKPDPYNVDYFTKYQTYAATDLGRRLNDFRLKTVNKYTSNLVIDIGIGCGQFVEARNNLGYATLGVDVNPLGLAWLEERGLLANLNTELPVVTFFDSLEHIANFSPILNRVTKFCIVSLPIFTDYNHILRSKHYRKDEHYHYFSHRGFVSMMWKYGLRLIEQSDAESDMGREGVRTFVFRKL